MSFDEKDEPRNQTPPPTEIEESASPQAPASNAPDATPAERARWRIAARRIVTRRNAAIAALAIGGLVLALVVLVVMLYRGGTIDRQLANQIKGTLAQYGIRAEIEDFHTVFSNRTVEMRNVKLYDAQTGAQLGRVERLLATVRVEDMFALNLQRNINLESLEVNGLEAWVTFDEAGHSNFGNLRLPAPDPNRRILFSYSTAQVKVSNSVVHYADERYEISGDARNIRLTVQPDDPNRPAESWMNTVALSVSDSTFVYNGRPVERISVDARGRINQTRADIEELTLRSPIAEARLKGTMDDWRNLRYYMNVVSNVDLTQASDVLQTGTPLRGAGRFEGTVAGEGTRYEVEGQIKSDALAAANVRLQGLNVSARASGEGESYEAQGRAVAEILTAGDFRLSTVQLAGQVMGTGTDFRWLGELRAAAARSGSTSISELILRDVVAESRDENLTATVGRANAGRITTSSADMRNVTASGVRFGNRNDATTVTAASVNAASVAASGARVNGVTASGVTATTQGNTTSVVANNVRVGSVNAAGARTGSLNIAGVRLSIRDNGRIEGTAGNVNVGTVALDRSVAGGGRVENVRVARPVFTVEPSGRYRVTADLSLGGGVLGELNLGAAQSRVVATNDAIQLNDFTANVLNGQARGNAIVSTARGGASRVAADFTNLDVGGLVALLGGRVTPVSGGATGNLRLAFPGTNISAASGEINARINAEAGNDARGRTPVTGDIALRADRGVFNIERADLQTGATTLRAGGQFSINGNSDLQIDLASADAIELQRVLVSTGLAPDLAASLEDYGIELAGNLKFNGTLRGKLTDPVIAGRAALDSLLVQGRDLGALNANIDTQPNLVRITDGRLTERDGGGATFTANVPLDGASNIAIDATLDRINAGNLLAALGGANGSGASLLSNVDLRSDLSGQINVTGLPRNATGNANLRFAPGTLNNQPFDSMIAQATFNGSLINLENLDAQFRAGRVNATGNIDIKSRDFNLQARGTGVQLGLLASLTGSAALPQISGIADFTANGTGNLNDFSTFKINLDGQGRDVTINGRPAGTLALTGRTENGLFDLQLTTGLLGQPQVIAARVDLRDRNLPTTIETTLSGADLTPLFAALLPQANVKVTGRATGTLRATGNLFGENAAGEQAFSFGALRGTARFSELSVQIEDVQLNAEDPLLVQFSPNEVFFERTRFTGPGTNLLFGGTAALGVGGRQNLTVDGDLNLRVLNGISPDVFLAGAARVGVRLSGTYEDPRLTGTASVAGASFSTLISDERLTISSINGLVRFNSNRAQIDNLTGRLGGGRVSVAGGALIEGYSPSQFRFSVRGEDVTVPFPENFRSTADADLVVQGTLQSQIITGAVNLRRADYTENIDLSDLLNQRREGSLTEGGSGEGLFGANTQLDLTITGRDALVVRNNLADAVGSVALQVRGPLDDPVVSGRITATRGTLSFRNDRYEITRGIIDLPARRNADPVLNIQAESEIRGYRVTVGLAGELTRPTVNLRSDPSLPQADVVALVTTGDLATGDASASTLAQSGIGTAASLLTDQLINAPVQRATDRLFGLNRFEIDPIVGGRGGTSPTARLTVGRRINRNLTVTYSTNVTQDQNQVIALEYRVSDRLSFVAQYEQGSTGALRSTNNNFNFEIRFRKRF
ncbi:MAG: translocation/assembly module TamB domain-containing protein [Pyrinomonadaceae bacterium]|nr:translocation/assembly module TamB domain-containing protein [Pyrinomonadaceae bacterium]